MISSMKRYIQGLVSMVLSVVIFASCMGSNDNETDYSNNTAITSFSLATVNRYIHTTGNSGQDSVYVSKLSNPVTFTIDQYNGLIYNTDSLPTDVDVKHVLATINSKNNGTIFVVNNDTLYYYSSTDSIDFSKPREIRVYAQNGQDYRKYTVTVNVHQMDNSTLSWKKMNASDFPDESEEDLSWKEAALLAGMKQYIGHGRAEGYAFNSDGMLMVSEDKGLTWRADNLEEDASWLPTDNIAFCSYPFIANFETDYQLMIGTSDKNDKACVVWRKIAEFAENSLESKWVLVPVESNNSYYLPKMDNLNLVHFNDVLLAIGNNGKIYQSQDWGLTWKTTTKYTLPTNIGTYNLKVVVDENDYLWLEGLDTGEVWRGIMIE